MGGVARGDVDEIEYFGDGAARPVADNGPSPPAFVGIREVHRRRAEREAGDDGPHAMRFNFGFHERLLAIELTIRLGQRIYPRQPASCHPPCRLDIDDGAVLPCPARVALGRRLDYGSSVSGVLECRDALPYKEPEC